MGPVARACALLALIVIYGCASYEPRPISPAENAVRIDKRSLAEPRLREFIEASRSVQGKPHSAVWDLDALTLAAVYYQPDVDLARAKLAAARARMVTARQVPNPSLDLALSRNGTTNVPSPWTVGIMVGFMIETFGKRQYRSAEAEQLAAAARDDLASATWLVRARVRAALLDLWAAERRLSLNRERLEKQEDLVRLIEKRFRAGEASGLDLSRERINRNQASLALRDAERQAVESRAQLAQAIGVPLRALDGLTLSLEAFDEPIRFPQDASRGELRHRALIGRSDVQGLLAEYAAAQSALQLQIARQYPNVKLGPGYTYDQGDRKYDVSVGMELPVFNRNEGPIAEAEARRAELAARLTALQARIISLTDGAAATLGAASASLDNVDSLVLEAGRREDAVRRGFAAGQFDRPSLVSSEVELVAARLAQLEAFLQRHRALGQLEDALQEPFFGSKGGLPVPERNPRVAERTR